MTRIPAENRDVRGIPYDDKHPKYKCGPLCSVPGCSRIADHAHHIWRRSFLVGDYGWVRLWDGTVVQNLTGLCWRHHQDITENKSIISWVSSSFWWYESSSSAGYLLDPQPKVWGNVNVELPSQVMSLTGKDVIRTADGQELHVHYDGPGSVEKCPSCKRSLPRPKSTSEAPRPRKNWTVTVPVDERENGAEVLDTLLEGCAELFGHDESKQLKYFTLAQALALVLQDHA